MKRIIDGDAGSCQLIVIEHFDRECLSQFFAKRSILDVDKNLNNSL